MDGWDYGWLVGGERAFARPRLPTRRPSTLGRGTKSYGGQAARCASEAWRERLWPARAFATPKRLRPRRRAALS